MSDADDLKKRIEALENENRTLRDAVSNPAKRNVIIVTEGSFEGHPTICFEAGRTRVTLGLRKAAMVLYCMEQLKKFVSRQKGELKDWEVVRGTGDSGGGKADVQI
jgi:hypothetical protein